MAEKTPNKMEKSRWRLYSASCSMASIRVKAPPGDQEALIASEPTRYFRPPYVGPSGWVGAWLDEVADWDTLAEILVDGYRMTAPKKLLAQLKPIE